MKLLKPRTFIIFALAALSGTVLLHTSQSVQHAEERLESLELSIYREEEKVRMLRAEWESLNRPERLERLANEFLDLVPPSSDQMAGGHMEFPDPEAEPIQFDVEESSEPILQPVSFDASEAAMTSVPKPQVKPRYEKKSAPKNVKSKEKAFGDLLHELGQEGGAQ